MPEQQTARNVATGAEVVIEVPTVEEMQIFALQRERDGYVLRGLADRVKAVDAELKRMGAAARQPADVPRETVVESKPQSTAGRSRRGSG
ncbi:hypothetical protein [Streptomyces jumonjinensis]|uniref:Uncharacterized protein n=1 Tax=Streptomyces jumonjinensis TaxID=1945 RepID=A0A646KLP9_STRJU|nr:hypothetical protein [Streptomyces jumonjinensis]MQT03173.1 hypothetical protein [Streptomyces jumonjinensis]